MGFSVLWSLDDWADAVAALRAAGPLPVRTVLVPSERHAHALRRALLATGRGAALAGTRFVRPADLAEELLRAAGVAFTPGEDGLRAARLRVLFEEDLALDHFDLELLRTAPGWDEAVAHAIGELEAAGLRPE
ncbi:MAG TPA: PD-(D/E)XK nuclease family protein, partial [Anaeromyxobacteraceae bacterium]|nr:PD-(D/E)XK nuclease family protein [Anaeromyxobacteraceae bacterium]